MATHYSILAWKISWTEEPTVHGVTESDTTEQLNAYLSTCFCKPKENFHFYQNKSHNYSNGELCKKKKQKTTKWPRDFLGGLVTKTPCAPCRGLRLDP